MICKSVLQVNPYIIFSNLKWQGNSVIANFCCEAVIQQNVINLQFIPKYARCNPCVQELDSPSNTNGNCHSLWPVQHILLSPICQSD